MRADLQGVRWAVRTGLTAALVAAALAVPPGGPVSAAPESRRVTAADLPRLQAELDRVTDRAQRLADALEAAAARDGGLRTEIDRLAQKQEEAQVELDRRVRQVYMRTRHDPVTAMVDRVAAPDLERLTEQGAAAAVRVDRQLVDAVASSSAAVRALQERARAHREQLRVQAADVLAAQDTARALLARAQEALAQQQARLAAEQAEQQARQQAAAVLRQRAADAARLASTQLALDRVSATVTRALTPAQTRRSVTAARTEAPLVALVEAAGAGYPQGYGPSGTVLRGVASWYGPGFVGNPTASGAPYDPERLTCAHRTLPLGTVVRVSRDGRAISCLVNDRGPYVGERILDLSRAGSRALGFDGVAPVAVEVLRRIS